MLTQRFLPSAQAGPLPSPFLVLFGKGPLPGRPFLSSPGRPGSCRGRFPENPRQPDSSPKTEGPPPPPHQHPCPGGDRATREQLIQCSWARPSPSRRRATCPGRLAAVSHGASGRVAVALAVWPAPRPGRGGWQTDAGRACAGGRVGCQAPPYRHIHGPMQKRPTGGCSGTAITARKSARPPKRRRVRQPGRVQAPRSPGRAEFPTSGWSNSGHLPP